MRGVSGASRRKQEVAQGKQEVAEASRARATPRSFWRGGRRQGEALGWAAGGAGPGGPRGERQVSFLSSLLLFLFNSVFYLIATEFKFKQI